MYCEKEAEKVSVGQGKHVDVFALYVPGRHFGLYGFISRQYKDVESGFKVPCGQGTQGPLGKSQYMKGL